MISLQLAGELRFLLVPLVLAAVPLRVFAGAKDRECSGYDEIWQECPDLPSCDTCVARNCQWDQWGDWYDGGCVGLFFRTRNILKENNECGKPCRGVKTGSKANLNSSCVPDPEDCELSTWSTWTECTEKTTVRFRDRAVLTYPKYGGEECSGLLKDTEPCGGGPAPTPCEFGVWNGWTECSATCGSGVRHRKRTMIKEAQNGGAPCSDAILQSDSCSTMPCPDVDCKFGEWDDWNGDCEKNGQLFRHRRIAQFASGDGTKCEGSRRQVRGCPDEQVVDCELSDWHMWEECSVTCGGGQTYRKRSVKTTPANGGVCSNQDLAETKPCGDIPCKVRRKTAECEFTAWAEWAPCSTTCGKGSRIRARKIAGEAVEGGEGCVGALSEIKSCSAKKQCLHTDCRWGQWYDWSGCSCTCGGGTKLRTRVVETSPRNGGRLCNPLDKSEVVPCNQQPCDGDGTCINGKWGKWKPWSTCSATCDSGYRSRRRELVQQPNVCGKAAEGPSEQFEECKGLPPCSEDQNCVLSQWGSWSMCSCTCFGVRERNRHFIHYARGKGKACVDESLNQVQPCNPGVDEKAPSHCGPGDPINCELSKWSDWGACSLTCGGGQQERHRDVVKEAKNRGKQCHGELRLIKPCKNTPCEKEDCVSCQWGKWSDWSVCTQCGGQRERRRSIERLPNYCGKACGARSAYEISNCTSQCESNVFCVWSDWYGGGHCQGGCGAGSEVKSRSLGLKKISKLKASLFQAPGTPKCSGTQLNMTTCENQKPCENQCQPENCKFGDWGEWGAPTCIGLCERTRRIATVNNECGKPCDGPLISTKKCEADCNKVQDCVLGDWGKWGDCSGSITGQRARIRSIVTMPEHGGDPCKGALKQTEGCGNGPAKKVDCEVSTWERWSKCSATCNGGYRTRKRQVTTKSLSGGEPCEESLQELEPCGEKPCSVSVNAVLGQWSGWSHCDDDHQRYRTRKIVKPAKNGGIGAMGDLEEAKGCTVETQDCAITSWTAWGKCDKTCGGGQRSRARGITLHASDGGRACPESLAEVAACNTRPCAYSDCQATDWSSWTKCSTTCGSGQIERTRKVTSARSVGAPPCDLNLKETKPCADLQPCQVVDCLWGHWSDWSGCTCPCNGGQRWRNRRIEQPPRVGGAPCKPQNMEEIAPCNTGPCDTKKCVNGRYAEWEDWTPCSSSCGGGTTYRIRKMAVMASDCGKPAEGKDKEVKFCNLKKSCTRPVNCEFTRWGPWGTCSAECNGIKHRERDIKVYGRGAGQYCLGGLKEIAPCNSSAVEKVPAKCQTETSQPCIFSRWSKWGKCSVTCDGGQQERIRTIAQQPKGGGKYCKGDLSQVQQCGMEPCVSKTVVAAPVNCQFGAWEDWGACGKCSGQRKRFRHIAVYAQNGGKNCDHLEADEETAKCPRECDERRYCTWGVWAPWSACNSECGSGKRSRRRYLMLSTKKADPPKEVKVAKYLVDKYEQLEISRDTLTHNKFQELCVAFLAGCFVFAVGLSVFNWRSATTRSPRASEVQLVSSEQEPRFFERDAFSAFSARNFGQHANEPITGQGVPLLQVEEA